MYEIIGLIAEHKGSLQRMVQMKWWKRELVLVLLWSIYS